MGDFDTYPARPLWDAMRWLEARTQAIINHQQSIAVVESTPTPRDRTDTLRRLASGLQPPPHFEDLDEIAQTLSDNVLFHGAQAAAAGVPFPAVLHGFMTNAVLLGYRAHEIATTPATLA